jgi:Spy/CpxP family protein refolding chaperone
MKKYSFFLMLLFTSFTFAQIDSFDESYIDKLKEDVDATSKEIVSDNLTLTESEAKMFWPLYDEYMAARNPIMETRLKTVSDYMQNYSSMDDKTADELMNRSLLAEQELLDLKKEYLKKMSEVLPATLVGKYYQIENRISGLIDLVRMSSIPLIKNEE